MGQKNMLKAEGKAYNVKVYHYIKQLSKIKQVSFGCDNVDDFSRIIKPIRGYYYIFEYIFNDKLCKPYFDYDLMLNEQPSSISRINKIDWIVLNIQKVFNQMYKIELSQDDLVLADSSGQKKDKYKFSLHILVNTKYVFKNNKDCIHVFQELHKLDKGFDPSVYSTDRMMRTPISAKGFDDQRVMRILDKNYNPIDIQITDLHKYLITNVPENYEIIPVTALEKRTTIHKTIRAKDNKAKDNKKEQIKAPVIPHDAKIDRIVEIIQSKFHEDTFFTKYTFTDPETGYQMYSFNYTDHSVQCFTGHKHDQIGFYCYLDNCANIVVKCFSSKCKNCKYIVGNINQSYLGNDYIQINQRRLLPDDCSLTENNDKIVKQLIKLKKKLKATCYWSAMGSGKSYLMEYNVKRFGYRRVLILSTRQSYANNMIQNFAILDFINYLDDKQWIKKDRIIVQLESLDKILKNIIVYPFDLIILDECESILYQFASTTIAGSSRETFNLLHQLCSIEHTKVLALDADWSERSEKFIKSLGSYEVIQNTYQPQERVIQFTANYDAYNDEIFSSIRKGEKICISILSTKEIAYLKKKLKKMGVKFIIHTRDTDDELKRLLKTVNELWIQFQVVIFSPTISVGVDFCVKYFDKIFAYVVPNTASPRIFLQMLGRVREVKNNNILTYYNNLSTKTDQYIYNYRDVYNYYQFVATDPFLNKELKVDGHGNIYNINKIGLYEEIMIYNEIENLNKSTEYFITSLNMLCSYKNYRLQFLDNTKPTKREDCDDDYIELIVNSADIDQFACNKIYTKMLANKATEAEKFSFQKFKIKSFWKIDNVTLEFLQTHFRKERILINLRCILDKNLGSCSSDYIDNDIDAKCEVILEIVTVLGFDLTDLDKVIGMKEFYENGHKLVSDSNFSARYKKIRILFNQSKKKLDSELTGGNFFKMINGYLKDFGLYVYCKKKSKRVATTDIDNGKEIIKSSVVKDSVYSLCINSTFIDFIE